MTYTAVYERGPDRRWIVRIPEVPGCHSYGRTIGQARERIREALNLFVDNADDVEIVDDVRLPKSVGRWVQTAKDLRAKVAREELAMVAAQQKAVVAIRKMKLGHRDAGQLLELSHQRVQQLEQREVRKMHGAMVKYASKKR